MSLRWRLTTALAALAMVIGLLVAWTSYLTTSNQLHDGIDTALRARAAEIGRGPGRSGASTVEDNGCPPDPLLLPAAAAQIVRDDGTIAVCLISGPRLPPPTHRLATGTVELSTVTTTGIRYRVAATAFHGGGTLQLAQSLTATDHVLDALRRRLLLVIVIAASVAGFAGWLLARQLIRPLVALRDATHELSRRIRHHQDLDTTLPTATTQEVRNLRASITTLVDALATSREQQQRLVADAGHEIRTPLTSLRANLDLLDRGDELDEPDRVDIRAAMRADLDEMTDLMTQLVDLAADPTREEPVVDVDLAELAEGVAARAQRRSGRTITVDSTNGAQVRGRPAMLERAIANLVDNAIKYSPHDAPVEVRTTPTSVVVTDRGTGIADQDKDRIFDRFWRADNARSQTGAGLGLAIVRQIIERHDGALTVERTPAGGTSIGFQLPDTGGSHRPQAG